MAVVNKEVNQSDVEQEVREVEARKTKALSDIVSSLDLPETKESKEAIDAELKVIRNKEQKDLKEKRSSKELRKEVQEEEVEEEIEEDSTEDSSAEDESQDESEDEDLIPKSKVEKRFKDLTSQIRELKSQLKQTPRSEEAPAVSDPDQAKLEQMTPDNLKTVLKQVRAKQLRISAGEETGNLDEYTDLEMKVHDALASYPQRFYNAQVRELNQAISNLENDEDIQDPKEAAPEIRKIAEKLYANHPHFASTRNGMKAAWELAVEHYKVVQNNDRKTDDNKKLKRDNFKLKRKTTLDSSKTKSEDPSNRKIELLRKKLMQGGTDQDRSDFVKESKIFNIDNLLPEEWR